MRNLVSITQVTVELNEEFLMGKIQESLSMARLIRNLIEEFTTRAQGYLVVVLTRRLIGVAEDAILRNSVVKELV